MSKDGTEAKTKKRNRRNNEMPTNVNVGPISNNLAGSNMSRMTAMTTNVSNYNQQNTHVDGIRLGSRSFGESDISDSES